jgi:hypothetical protein
MITVDFISGRSRSYEMHVRALASQYKGSSGTLDIIKSNLENDILTVPKQNNATADMYYKVGRARDERGQILLIYHTTVLGDIDRHIGIIRDTEKPDGNWWQIEEEIILTNNKAKQ